MLTVSSGTFTEDFFQGYPYAGAVSLPPEFDYEGAALTNRGVITCVRGDFTLQFGSGSDNSDAALPYGGPPSSNFYYLRFPVLSWGETAGLFLTVTLDAPGELVFDRAWSGYVGDSVVVVVNGIERQSLTGSAGYSWTRSTLQLGAGRNEIAFLLATAPYSSGKVVREGISQPTPGVIDLFRYLRLTNLALSPVSTLPTASNQRLVMEAESSLSGEVKVAVTVKLAAKQSSRLIWPAKLSGPVQLRAEATFAQTFTAGKWTGFRFDCRASFTATVTHHKHAASDTGGLGLASRAELAVSDVRPVGIGSELRPLTTSSLVMERPIIVHGRPAHPKWVSESEWDTFVEAGTVLSKVDPLDKNAQLPVRETWRWLSIDAQSNPETGELLRWHATDFHHGPVWTTPGAYLPQVGNFTMKSPQGVASGVRYPAVTFDSTKGDHLLGTIPEANNQTMSWVFVGTFSRYRGMWSDSCPILDLAPSQSELSYDYQSPIARSGQGQWYDNEPVSSVYLGLTLLSAREPTISQVAVRSQDGNPTFLKSSDVVLTDNTPVVLVYTLNGGASYVRITPIVVGSNNAAAALTARFRRADAFDASQQTYALGRSRLRTPFGGNFQTGSMSLLDVAFYDYALTEEQAEDVSNALVALYTPVSGDKVLADLTKGSSSINSEQVLIYAGDPETQLALISGASCVVTGLWPSDQSGKDLMSTMLTAGIPTVECSNEDYAVLVAQLTGDNQ